MKRSTDNRRSPAEIKADLYRHYGGLEHSDADMTDFRRPPYAVKRMIRAQGEQIERKSGVASDGT